MLLAVDVGNTQTHIGVFDGEDIVAQWRTHTDRTRTADELALTFRQFLSLHQLSFDPQITGVVVSSVVPPLTAAIREMVERYFSFTPIVVEPGTRTGMPIHIENPGELGADRICNAVAGYALTGGPLIVLDFGTATTFDVISQRGEYLGGAIAPGVQVSADALAQAAARLPRVELVAPRSVIGKSTIECVRAGILLGSAAMVDGMVDRIRAEMKGEPQVVATGGLAPLVLEHCTTKARFEPTLTLTGLRILYERNV
ncbi:MAG TPA: type III pantothenate kinase [Actinomycetota bacterium]|nr:type III pantothenate kinase [Actinomycetota bacterium]